MSIIVHADRNVGSGATFTSGVSTLTVTASAGDLVVAHICLTSNNNAIETISSIATISGQPAWTKRKQDSHHDAGGGRELFYNQEVWYFVAASNITNQTAVVTAAGGSSQQWCYNIHSFGNVNTSNPWDSNAAVPTTSVITTSTGTAGTFTGLSTTNAPGMIVQFVTFGPRSGETHDLDAPGSGFSALGSANNAGSSAGLIGFTRAQYKSYATNQSSVSGSFTGTSTYLITWGDAIREADNSITIDGTATGVRNAADGLTTIVSGNFSTSGTNRIVCAIISCDKGTTNANLTVSSVTSPNLTWTFYGRQQNQDNISSGLGAISTGHEIWYAIAASQLTNEVVTATWSATMEGDMIIFGVAGGNTSSPFDTNAGLPFKRAQVGTNAPSITSVATTGAPTLLVGSVGAFTDTSPGIPVPGALLKDENTSTGGFNWGIYSFYNYLSVARSAATLTWPTSVNWSSAVVIAFAKANTTVTTTIAQTLAKATQSATVTETTAASIAQTLSAKTQAANVYVSKTNIAQTLQHLTQDFEALENPIANIAQTLSGVLSQDFEAAEVFPFAIDQTLSGALVSAVNAAITIPGTIDQTLSGTLIHDLHGHTGFSDIAVIQTLLAIQSEGAQVIESFPAAINQVLSGALVDDFEDIETLPLSIDQTLQGRLTCDFEAIETLYVSIDQTLPGALKNLTSVAQLQPAGNPAFSSWWAFGP